MDKDSQAFITWAMQYLDDPEQYKAFLKDRIEKFRNYIAQNPATLKRQLEKKFIKGGIEHGSPLKYTQAEIEKETELEYLDMLGWPLVGKFIEENRKG